VAACEFEKMLKKWNYSESFLVEERREESETEIIGVILP